MNRRDPPVRACSASVVWKKGHTIHQEALTKAATHGGTGSAVRRFRPLSQPRPDQGLRSSALIHRFDQGSVPPYCTLVCLTVLKICRSSTMGGGGHSDSDLGTSTPLNFLGPVGGLDGGEGTRLANVGFLKELLPQRGLGPSSQIGGAGAAGKSRIKIIHVCIHI